MSTPTTRFLETSGDRGPERVPLSHLSIELGHLYMEDFEAGPEQLRRRLAGVVPWLEATRRSQARADDPRHRPRISTCFLVDDYFTRFRSPAEVLPELLDALGENGLTLDYLARESACADADDVPLARLLEAGLVPVPAPGDNGARPPVTQSGWLSNGQRSSSGSSGEAMAEAPVWAPPVEIGARWHSIFADVQLWDETDDRRIWSCPFLAAVWQCMRLGLLRNRGQGVVRPRPWAEGSGGSGGPGGSGDFPDDWDELPPVVQLNPAAAPFAAYRTFSILEPRFMAVENAVRVILGQFAADPEVLRQVDERRAGERLAPLGEIVDRISYVFHSA